MNSQQDPFTAAIAQALQAMLGQQTDPMAKGKNNAMTIAALRNDPVGDRNKAYMPGAVAGTSEATTNPFTNGFFRSSAAGLTPEQLARSQGGNAINQWADPVQFPGQEPTPQAFQGWGPLDSERIMQQRELANGIGSVRAGKPFDFLVPSAERTGLVQIPGESAMSEGPVGIWGANPGEWTNKYGAPEMADPALIAKWKKGAKAAALSGLSRPKMPAASASPFSGFKFGAGVR